MGDEVMPTDPGGVTLMAGDYGTYVKSGSRVGILPHFVPTAPVEIPEIPEPEAATVCMPEWDAEEDEYFANDKDCMLGDGGTNIVMTAMTSDGRSSREVTSVHRNPGGGDDIEIALELWGNGSGHVAGSTENVFLGWNVPGGQGRTPEAFEARTWVASLDSSGNLGTGLSDAGVRLNPGMPRPFSTGKVVAPATDGMDDGDTPQLDNGFYRDSVAASTTFGPAGTPQCMQNVRTVTDGGGGTVTYLQFAAASGSDPVEIEAWSENAPTTTEGTEATLDALETWVEGHNDDIRNKGIKTVRVAKPGETNTPYKIPAVVCAFQMEDRYVGATLSISPTTTYCNRDNNRTAVVYVLAYGARGRNGTTPEIAQTVRPNHWTHTLNTSTALQVHCPTE